MSTHLLSFLTGFRRHTLFDIASGSTSFSSGILVNLDSIKRSQKAELEMTHTTPQGIPCQAKVSLPTKSVLSFQCFLWLMRSRTWECSSVGLSPFCGRTTPPQGDKSNIYNSRKGMLQESCPTWLFAQERKRKGRAVPRMPLPRGVWPVTDPLLGVLWRIALNLLDE